VLLDNGTVYTSGDNTFCKLVIPTAISQEKSDFTPTKLVSAEDSGKDSFSRVANGYAYSIGIKEEERSSFDGEGKQIKQKFVSMWGWGTGFFGTVFSKGQQDSIPAHKMIEHKFISEDEDEELCGESIENADDRNLFNCPFNLHRIKKISCGDAMVVALTGDYHVFSWGSNAAGRLGNGKLDSEERRLPAIISAFEGKKIIKIACGGSHSIALGASGKVYSWGSGGVGVTAAATLEVTGGPARLGHGEDSPFYLRDSNEHFYLNTPKRICGIDEPVKSISAGQWHSFVLLEDGRVMVFGGNSFGQLGVGHNRPVFQPIVSPFLSFINARKLIAGRLHSGAITHDGRVFTWGCGLEGQLGNGKFSCSFVPVLAQIPERFFVVKLSIGKFQTLVTVRVRQGDDYEKTWQYPRKPVLCARAVAEEADDSDSQRHFLLPSRSLPPFQEDAFAFNGERQIFSPVQQTLQPPRVSLYRQAQSSSAPSSALASPVTPPVNFYALHSHNATLPMPTGNEVRREPSTEEADKPIVFERQRKTKRAFSSSITSSPRKETILSRLFPGQNNTDDNGASEKPSKKLHRRDLDSETTRSSGRLFYGTVTATATAAVVEERQTERKQQQQRQGQDQEQQPHSEPSFPYQPRQSTPSFSAFSRASTTANNSLPPSTPSEQSRISPV
jgi:alpha-tubulin suppressor-like RCC1 family protein